jgi:hypothetical protein
MKCFAPLGFLLLLLIALPARSQNDASDATKEQAENEGLKVSDYKTVPVIVLEIEPNDAKITDDAVRTRVESRMKAAGLAMTPTPKDHFLLITVRVEGSAFSMNIGFYRQASWELPDGKVASNFLETWDAGDALGTHNNTDALIMQELDARIGLFLSTYFRANQNSK